jgi:ribosomal protein L20
VQIDRKVLADIAVRDIEAFAEIAEIAKPIKVNLKKTDFS